MRLRAVPIMATMVLGMILLSGVVLAKTCGATCYGNSGKNNLIGTNSKNEIHAKGGADAVKGLRSTDWLFGGGGDDVLSGGPGIDDIYGGPDEDRLNGKEGNDWVTDIEHFASSSTALQKQRTVDVLIGDRGNDTIRARDGKKDIVRGGPGNDTAYVDLVDTVTGVEKEVVPGDPDPDPNLVPNDTTAPLVTIDSGPTDGEEVDNDSFTFEFSANEPCTFECRLKGPNNPDPPFTSCEKGTPTPAQKGSKAYTVLGPGSYTFELRATDTANNITPVPPRNFKVCIDGDCSAQ
jgi:hypothetical protein